jgi:cytochrome c-type protein NapC
VPPDRWRRICANHEPTAACGPWFWSARRLQNGRAEVLMLPLPIVVALAAGVAIVALLLFGARALAAQRVGRLVLLVGLVALPLLLSAGNLSYGIGESSQTRFCLSCHEMQRHGRSLFVDDRQALSAVHYQNRLVERDTTCYACHKDYALFGDVRAKLNGLRHVWAHYVRGVPAKIELYQPYPNANCLHCHDDGRRFLEKSVHRPVMAALQAGTTSCLSCHRVAHDMAKVDAGRFWGAE